MIEKSFNFSFFGNYYLIFKKLGYDKDFLTAIVLYVYEGIEPEFEGEEREFLWQMIEPSLKKSREKGLRENKGGAPRGNKNAQKQPEKNN